jgi:hypothetical protein
VNDWLDKAVATLNKLEGLPAVALVMGSCIVLGYVLRFIKRFPNDGIPVAVILWGAVAMSLVADARTSSMTLRVWIARNVFVGMILGLLAWLLHKTLISRLEDWLVTKLPGLDRFLSDQTKTPGPPGPTGGGPA